MSKPYEVERRGDWRTERWPYDGAPLTAVSDSGVDVEFDGEDVRIEWTEKSDDMRGTATRGVWVPGWVLRALMDR